MTCPTPSAAPSVVTHRVGVPEGAPAGPARNAGPPGCSLRPSRNQDLYLPSPTRSFTMFQALYADLARACRRRRQLEYQRRLERQAQHEMLHAAPHMLAR